MSDVTEINAETGEVVVREYTYEELQRRANLQKPEDPVVEQVDVPNRQSALLKLQSLGLTEEEARALAGL